MMIMSISPKLVQRIKKVSFLDMNRKKKVSYSLNKIKNLSSFKILSIPANLNLPTSPTPISSTSHKIPLIPKSPSQNNVPLQILIKIS